MTVRVWWVLVLASCGPASMILGDPADVRLEPFDGEAARIVACEGGAWLVQTDGSMVDDARVRAVLGTLPSRYAIAMLGGQVVSDCLGGATATPLMTRDWGDLDALVPELALRLLDADLDATVEVTVGAVVQLGSGGVGTPEDVP